MADAESTTNTSTAQSGSTTNTQGDNKNSASVKSGTFLRNDIIDPALFSLPQDKDYYINAVDIDWYEKIRKAYEARNPSNIKDGQQQLKDAVFYTEDPPLLNPGYYQDYGVYVLQPDISDMQSCSTGNDKFCGFVDGDTIYFHGPDTKTGDEETQEFVDDTAEIWQSAIMGYKNLQDMGTDAYKIKSNFSTLEVRVLCIDCPEVPHLSIVNKEKVDSGVFSTKEMTLEEADSAGATYVKYKCVDNSDSNGANWKFEERDKYDTKSNFVYINGNWHEYLTVDEVAAIRGDSGAEYGGSYSGPANEYFFTTTDSTDAQYINQGYEAGRMMSYLINQASDCRIMVNASSQSRKGDSNYPSWSNTLENSKFVRNSPMLRAMIDLLTPDELADHSIYNQTGFNQLGQELYGRVLGAVYLYVPFGEDGSYIWINAAKYILSQLNGVKVNKSINGSVTNGKMNNYLPDIFKPYSYEYNEKMWADEVWNILSKLDERYKIQNTVFRNHTGNLYMRNRYVKEGMDELKDWTVLLGDVAFMVPPTSIRSISQTMTERVPVVRARGSIAKGDHHVDQLIEMSLYFNELDGINGVPVEWELPNSKEGRKSTTTYYMNGLRALLAEFKLTPFLPIENKYINEVLNIDAVCFASISISTVPGFPRLMQCTLTLRKFDVSAYMPQLPKFQGVNNPSIPYRNYFAETINYDTMRFYYQRPLQLGNELSNIDVTSKEFMSKTLFSNRTALIPYTSTSDSLMSFYIADEDYLRRLLQLKHEVQNKKAGDNFFLPTPKQKKFISSIAPLGKALADINADSTVLKYRSSTSTSDQLLNRMCDILRDEGGPLVSKVSIENYIDENSTNQSGAAPSDPYLTPTTKTIKKYISVKLNLTGIITDDADLRTLKEEAAQSGGYDANYILQDNTVTIYLKENTISGTININQYTPDYQFIAYCTQINGTTTGNETAERTKQYMDIEQLESMQFIPYIEDVRISSISSSFSNTFTNVSLQNSGFVSPQYMGGSDATVQITLQTTDKQIAGMLAALPRIESYLHRTYQEVLPLMPIKIVSAFTKLMGITEVTIDSSIVNTVPGFPGLYAIQMSLVSTDRTLRNREALRKIDIQNDSAASSESQNSNGIGISSAQNSEPGHNTNEHLSNSTTQSKDKIQTYFDLDTTISKVNLYPDLELPTIDELAKYGFQFIRYKNRQMTYPDPDFYILYPGIIMNEAVRASIMMFLSNKAQQAAATSYKDQFGAQFTMNADGSLNLESCNDIYRKELEKCKERDERELKRENEIAEQNFSSMEGATKGDLGAWDIAPSIKVCFLESYYYKRILDYKNYAPIGNDKTDSQVVSSAITTETGIADTDTTEKADQVETAQKKNMTDDEKAATIFQSQSKKKGDSVQKTLKAESSNTASGTSSSTKPNTKQGKTDNTASTQKTDEQIKKEQQDAINANKNRAEGEKINTALTQYNEKYGSQCDTFLAADPEKQSFSDSINLLYDVVNAYTTTDSNSLTYSQTDADTNTQKTKTTSKSTFADNLMTTLSMGVDGAGGSNLAGVVGKETGIMSDAVANNLMTGKTDPGETLKLRIERMVIAALAGRAGRYEYSSSFWDEWVLSSATGSKVFTTLSDVFNNKKDKDALWLPDQNIVGIVRNQDGEADKTSYTQINKDEIDLYKTADEIDAMTDEERADTSSYKQARMITEAGIFRMKFFTKEELSKIMTPDKLDASEGKNPNQKTWCLDPYYRYKTDAEIDKLKIRLMKDPVFAAIMFIRETIYWLHKLIEWYVFPNFQLDIMRQESQNESNVMNSLNRYLSRKKADIQANAKKEKEDKKSGDKSGQNTTIDTSEIEEFQKKTANAISKFLQKNAAALDLGKVFAAMTLAITYGDQGLIRCMIQRDYRALNGYVASAYSPNSNVESQELARGQIRKFVLGLVAEKIIDASKDIGKSDKSPAQSWLYGYAKRKVLQAANEPSKWLYHSFYDMCRTDYRGRLVRAFPTFYMIFVDEGRDLGYWKLHDNFYNTNAIAEVKIMKSRKIAADTAIVTMSNMFNTFTDTDEDAKNNYKYTFRDTIDSIFSPMKYAKTEEMRRQMVPEINRAKIRAGVRIHLRLGYGNDASLLPCSFNGTIAEIKEGPVIEFTAQGDGIELCNPILDVGADDTIDDLMYREDLTGALFRSTNGQTPRNIMYTLMTQTGGWLAKQMKDTRFSKYFNENPYGLYHFGDTNFNQIFAEGEQTQNLYEVDKNPSFGYLRVLEKLSDSSQNDQDDDAGHNADLNTEDLGAKKTIDAQYDVCEDEKIPLISFAVAHKTIWDILNICASTSPSFIGAVAPFGFRSTVFMGRPKYYYAYQYAQVDGTIVEKRKPFQQYHLYFENADIVKNAITASKKTMRTVVTGLYKRKVGPLTRNCKVGPLHADFEIYPENQKSIVYDTQYIAKNPHQDNYPNTKYTDQSEKEGNDPGLVSSIATKATNTILGVVHNVVSWLPTSVGEAAYDYAIPDSAKNDFIAKIAREMTASKLVDSLREMYQGQIIVVGDPSVKPFDVMQIQDSYRDMNGCCAIRDVTHMFSVKNGYVTAITPDCLNTTTDNDMYLIPSTLSHIAAWTTIGLGIFMAQRTLVHILGAKGASGVKKVEDFISGLMKDSQFLKNQKEALKSDSKVKKVLSFTTKHVNQIKGLKAVNAVTNAALALSGVGWVVLAGKLIASELVTYAIGDTIGGYFSNTLKNLRVSRIYPLKVHSLPYTAGLEGNMNLVAGGPTDGQKGVIGSLIGEYLAPSKGDSSFGLATVTQMLGGLFLDEEATSAAARFHQSAGITNAYGQPAYELDDMSKLLGSMYTGSATYYKGASSAMAEMPLCTFKGIKNAKRSAENLRVKTCDAGQLSSDTNLKKMASIHSYPGLQPYTSGNWHFLRLVHEGTDFSDTDRIHCYYLPLGDEIIPVNGIISYDSNGNVSTVDLPVLYPNALQILSEVVHTAAEKVKSDVLTNAGDEEQAINDLDNHYIVIKKALQAGDTSDRGTYSASGFSWVMQGYGSVLGGDGLWNICSAHSEKYPTVFQAKKLNNGEISCLVALPMK